VRRLLPLLALTLLSPLAGAFDLQAHRGGRALAPENTLPAFANALSMGVTTLELDTDITKDGVVVICHDPSLNPNVARGPDGQWLAKKGPAIHELTFAELSAYDVGRLNPESSYGKQFPDQKPVDGTRIPRLADLFALVKKSGNTQVRFNIETKLTPTSPDETLAPEPFTRAVLAVIRAAGMQERVTIQSFDWRTLQVVQELAPRIPAVYLTVQQKWLDNIGGSAPAAGQAPGPSPWTAGVQLQDHGSIPKMVRAAGGTIWSPYYGEVDAEKVAEAKALGLRTVVWTVNQPAAIEKMLDLGVDGIISDRPDLVRAEMKKRGMPLPAATPVSASN
jgi:glycerophosphoryl diester phosphodiesterase